VLAVTITSQVGGAVIPAVIGAVGGCVAAWIGRKNKETLAEALETIHKVNKAVNDVPEGTRSIGETVNKISDAQDEIKEKIDSGT
jgi:hypothetical protein